MGQCGIFRTAVSRNKYLAYLCYLWYANGGAWCFLNMQDGKDFVSFETLKPSLGNCKRSTEVTRTQISVTFFSKL